MRPGFPCARSVRRLRLAAFLPLLIGACLLGSGPARADGRGIETTTTTLTPAAACGNWTVTFRIDSAPVPVGALQIRVGYAGAQGEFVRDFASVWCVVLVEGGSFAATEFTEDSELVLGLISVDGVAAGVEYASCVFAGTFDDAPVAGDFAIDVEDATDVLGNAIEVVPAVDVTALTEPGDCEDRCGDGVVFGEEECDDANTSNEDECLGDCTLAACGDGLVHAGVEDCDDGNDSDLDDCLVGCVAPSCGDGFLRAGVEACDDGNDIETDACPACAPASCGDGFVYLDFEQCDDAGTDSHDGCSRICRFEQTCGNPIADGDIKSSDALRVLQKSVGIAVDCPKWACDVNQSAAVTVADALAVLRRAVQDEIALSCGLPQAVTFRVYLLQTSLNEIRSIAATVDYSNLPGELVGSGGEVECEPLIPGSTGTFHDDEETSRLTLEVGEGTTTVLPVDVARCNVAPSSAFGQEDFEVKSVTAKRANGSVLNVLLAVLPD